MYGYIYKITNNINGKIYIGQHKAQKFEPDVYLGSGKLLLQAYDKYGKDNFTCILLAECKDQEEMDVLEQFYIKTLDSTNLNIGYNLARGGFGGCSSQSEETREKLRIYNTGKILVNNGCKQLRIDPSEIEIYQQKGFVKGGLPFHRSNEFRSKLSKSTTGKRAMYQILPDGQIKTIWAYPEEFETLQSEGWCFGRKPLKSKKSEKDTLEKRKYMYKDGQYKLVELSKTSDYLANGWIFQCFTKGKPSWNKGKTMSSELRQKLSHAHIGEKHSPERVAKHSALLKDRVYMHKDNVNKLIPKGKEFYYESQGWIRGRVSKNSKC